MSNNQNNLHYITRSHKIQCNFKRSTEQLDMVAKTNKCT